MKNSIPFYFALLIFICGEVANASNNNRTHTINAILGDKSYVTANGCEPNEYTPPTQRIITHLRFVENLLRTHDVSHLASAQLANRSYLLDQLNYYLNAEVFPQNNKYQNQNRPCFIDLEGRICAVGYLIQMTSGRELAEAINQNHQYEFLLDMKNDALEKWIEISGLTKEECAMIQPMYGWEDPNSGFISTEYAITSGFISGLNLSLTTINFIQLAKASPGCSNAAPILGILGGGTQIAIGLIVIPNEDEYNYENESIKMLSMMNIGLGTSTVILSTWNLFSNYYCIRKNTSWNIYSIPVDREITAYGLMMSKRF